MQITVKLLGGVALMTFMCVAACATKAVYNLNVPLGIPAPKIPKDDPLTAEKVALGKRLFFDESFSFNGKVSCATCHIPEHGFADITSIGFTSAGGALQRNTPTIINAALQDFQFWDGRAPRLEDQVADVARPGGDTSIHINQAVKTITADKEYFEQFEKAFGEPPSAKNFERAIAAYERTMLSGGTRFDRFAFNGEQSALSPLEKQGYAVFLGKGNCVVCHTVTPTVGDKAGYATFIDQKFHNLGVGAYGSRMRDAGRYLVTGERVDFGAFKTPTLRNVELTSPYMHDGSIPTLEAVVEFYDRGGNPNKFLDPKMKPLHLTGDEKTALVAFLKTLSDDNLSKAYLPPAEVQKRIDKILAE